MPDPVTHVCLSFFVARHFFKNNKLLFVLAGISPDIDVAVGGLYILMTGSFPVSLIDFTQRSLIFHPTLSASLFFLPLFSLLLLIFFRLLKKDLVPKNFKKGFIIISAGILLHLSLDMLQPGNRPFWPLEFEAGFNVLPFTPEGRGITILASVIVVIIDQIYWFYKGRFGET